VILDAVKKRAKQLGYQSLTAYIVGLIRYDLMIGKDHPATVEISRQREEDQDAIDDELVRMYESGESLKRPVFRKHHPRSGEGRRELSGVHLGRSHQRSIINSRG